MEDTSNRVSILEAVTRRLVEKHHQEPTANLVVGVSGPVAAGKSRFAGYLKGTIQEIVGSKLINCPFDYWINSKMLNAPTYAARFYLEEFGSALRSIKTGDMWMCPRYDLVKTETPADIERLAVSSLEVIWEGRRFVKISSAHQVPDVPGGSGVYLEPTSRRLFSLFIPEVGTVYLMDGTLIFHQSTLAEFVYDAKVYVTSSWTNRVSRMIRRFNRREVFGLTTLTEIDYVGFLAREAVSCADAEIAGQIDDQTLIVHNHTETISNLLDIYYLGEHVRREPSLTAVYMIDAARIDEAVDQAYAYLSSITSIEHVRALKSEFANLIESKHLLMISNIDDIFKRLRDTLRV